MFKFSGSALTFLAVMFAWVFFRSSSFSGAIRILTALFDTGRLSTVDAIHPLLWNQGLHAEFGLLSCLLLAVAAVLLPNSNRIGEKLILICSKHKKLSFYVMGAAMTFAVLLVIINSLRTSVSAFIYFNF